MIRKKWTRDANENLRTTLYEVGRYGDEAQRKRPFRVPIQVGIEQLENLYFPE